MGVLARRLALASALALLLLAGAFASDGRVLPPGDGAYKDMEKLFLLEGKAGIQSSRPWSQAEARSMLARFDKGSLEGLSLALYERIEEKLGAADSLRVSLSVSPEIYAHANEEEFCVPLLWFYGFERRRPFALLSLSAGIGPFATYSELSYGWGRITNKDSFREYSGGIGAVVEEGTTIHLLDRSDIYSRRFLFNFPAVDMLHLETPGRTAVSLGWRNFYLGFHKDPMSWGRSRIGNFVFDGHVSDKSYLVFKAFNGKFGFDYVVYLPEADPCEANQNDHKGRTRLMLAHMLSWNILENLSLNVSENVMWNFTVPELRFLNPAYVYHNLNNSEVLNAIAHLEVEYVPIPSLRLYGQFVLDQATAPTEDNSQPAAWGLLLSAGCLLPLGRGSMLDIHLEGAYTTPFLYRRQGVDFLVFSRHAINKPYGKYSEHTYLGFPYGGDSIALEAGLEYSNLRRFSSALEALVVVKGGVDIFAKHSKEGNAHHPDIVLRTPSPGGGTSWVVSWDNRQSHEPSWGHWDGFVDLSLLGRGGALDFQFAAGISATI